MDNLKIKIKNTKEKKEDLVVRNLKLTREENSVIEKAVLRFKQEKYSTSKNDVMSLIIYLGLEQLNQIKEDELIKSINFDQEVKNNQVIEFVNNLKEMNYIKAGEKVNISRGKSLKLLTFLKSIGVVETSRTGTKVLKDLNEEDFVN